MNKFLFLKFPFSDSSSFLVQVVFFGRTKKKNENIIWVGERKERKKRDCQKKKRKKKRKCTLKGERKRLS